MGTAKVRCRSGPLPECLPVSRGSDNYEACSSSASARAVIGLAVMAMAGGSFCRSEPDPTGWPTEHASNRCHSFSSAANGARLGFGGHCRIGRYELRASGLESRVISGLGSALTDYVLEGEATTEPDVL